MIKKSSLSKRYNASYESKDGNTGVKKSVIDYKSYDGEVSFFKMTEGRHRINIVPYTVKSKNHPLVKKGDLDIGDEDYVMDLFVHRNIGPSESSVICLKQNYGKTCPICEQMALLKKQGKDDEATALRPSRRVFYNVEDLNEPGKVKILETSHYLFEKELIDEARNSAEDEDDGFINFASAEEGKEIKFRCSKVSKGGFEYNEPKNFSFVDREDPLSKKLLKSAISFDEFLIVLSAEEIEKIMFGQEDDEDEDEDEKPVKKSRHVEDEDDEEEEEPVKKSSKKSRHVEEEDEDSEDDEDEDSEDDEDEDSEDDEDEDSEEEEEKPVKKSAKKSPKVEDDDSEDEDESIKKTAKKSSCKGNCSKCKFGHKFGEDCDEFDDCEDCDDWDECVKQGD